MKTLFVNAISRKKVDYEKMQIEICEKISEDKLAICYSNQFKVIAEKLNDKLREKIIEMTQTLGCSNPVFEKEVQAILFIGQGKFHPVSLAYESGLPTYVLEGRKIWKVSEKEVERLKNREKGAYLKYLTSKRVGVLITTKPGQERLNKAIEFKKKLKKKKAYLFLANNLNLAESENFGIDCFINTSCPRMDLIQSGNLINLEKLEKLNSGHRKD